MKNKGACRGLSPEAVRRLVDDVPHIAEATPARRRDIERRYARALHAEQRKSATRRGGEA